MRQPLSFHCDNGLTADVKIFPGEGEYGPFCTLDFTEIESGETLTFYLPAKFSSAAKHAAKAFNEAFAEALAEDDRADAPLVEAFSTAAE